MQSPARKQQKNGFALIITVTMMVLLALLAVGFLSLATIQLRSSKTAEARAVALSNARMGLVLAIGELQKELGDDRRITADASVLSRDSKPGEEVQNGHAVGVWKSWSPDLISRVGSGNTPSVDYAQPKGEEGFRRWLVSSTDVSATTRLDWHQSGASGDVARLYTEASSGFELNGERMPVKGDSVDGTIAWAVTQENTKAKINVGTDDRLRRQQFKESDQIHAPSRPNLASSRLIKQPEDEAWPERGAKVMSVQQAALDHGYGLDGVTVGEISRDYTATAMSLLTNPVKGGVKIDLTSAFELTDSEFLSEKWGDVVNPFRDSSYRYYQPERPLFQPTNRDAQVSATRSFDGAPVTEHFNVNGAPTFSMLREFYRSYRHIYLSNGEPTVFERPFSHVAYPSSDRASGRPFGIKSQPSISPVLDRILVMHSVYVNDGPGTVNGNQNAGVPGDIRILLTPFVTVWNPYNVALETEGLVVYHWLDNRVSWYWDASSRQGSVKSVTSPGEKMSRYLGDDRYDKSLSWQNARWVRPFYYLHLTETGNAVPNRTKEIAEKIHFEPGEVKLFCLAENTKRHLDFDSASAARTWRMKSVKNATDITNALKSGISLLQKRTVTQNRILKMAADNKPYVMKQGDSVTCSVVFEAGISFYGMAMADSWGIKNPNSELMAEAAPQRNLRREPNLVPYTRVTSGPDPKAISSSPKFTYTYDELLNNPQLVGGTLTYHRTANSDKMQPSDLMYTVNPRQGNISPSLSQRANFPTAPHYATLMLQGNSLASFGLETSPNGRQAYYGASQSANDGRTHLPVFEIPREPILSLGALQQADITSSAYGVANQIGNSWASAYLPPNKVAEAQTTSAFNDTLTPGLMVYDMPYLANEALFDDYFFSGAAPLSTGPQSGSGGVGVWDSEQISDTKSADEVLRDFYQDPAAHPLRNPRMLAYHGSKSVSELTSTLSGPAKATRLAAYLLYEGGFNVNSTSVEAWAAVLGSLRGVKPGSNSRTPFPRYRDIDKINGVEMEEDDPWTGFRALDDSEIRTLAEKVVEEVKQRGPFLSLGEFVNRQVGNDQKLAMAGALQSAIDKSLVNRKNRYSNFSSRDFPYPRNIAGANSGTNTLGWLSQADLLTPLAPSLTVRSDTFIIRSEGQAKDAAGTVLASVMLEAVVQRVPEYVDTKEDPSVMPDSLGERSNIRFGRAFKVMSIRELVNSKQGRPV